MISDLVMWVREYQAVLEWLGLVSIVMFVATIIFFPIVVAVLPSDYFVRDKRDPAREKRRHPLVWGTLVVLKNGLGIILILAGLAMLVLPGQGLLTILIGVTLTNFPGKYTLERRLVRRPAVGRTLNRIRDLAKRPRLEMP